MTPDPRDGSMADINVEPMPQAQAEVFAIVPSDWAEMPRIGVHEMVLRALADRGLVEMRWRHYAREWRRPEMQPLPSPPKVE